jgi:hypothetical protein
MFTGTLYFDDESGDCITVRRLVLGDHQASLDARLTWRGEDGRDIEVSASLCTADEIYRALEITGRQGHSARPAFDMEFAVWGGSDGCMSVFGRCVDQGKTYPFSGTLVPR